MFRRLPEKVQPEALRRNSAEPHENTKQKILMAASISLKSWPVFSHKDELIPQDFLNAVLNTIHASDPFHLICRLHLRKQHVQALMAGAVDLMQMGASAILKAAAW